MPKAEERIIHLRLTCVDPPLGPDLEFGLQDRKQAIHDGQALDDGSILYLVDMTCTRRSAAGDVRFGGPFVHGTADEPFLYLSLKRLDAAPGDWVKRIKVRLPKLTWDDPDVETRLFAASVSGQGSATMRLLGEGWLRL